MSTRHVIDEEKGTKWFTFYTKIRPGIIILLFWAVVLPDFIFNKCADIEHPMLLVFQHPMLLISLGLSIAQIFVCSKTFDKSKGDYLEFAEFAPKVLAFEAVAMTIQGFIEQYYEKGFISALIVAVIIGVLAYFVWYRKMSDYFYGRVKEDTIN